MFKWLDLLQAFVFLHLPFFSGKKTNAWVWLRILYQPPVSRLALLHRIIWDASLNNKQEITNFRSVILNVVDNRAISALFSQEKEQVSLCLLCTHFGVSRVAFAPRTTWLERPKVPIFRFSVRPGRDSNSACHVLRIVLSLLYRLAGKD